MTKLIVMLILISGQGGPAVISGWSSMGACGGIFESTTWCFVLHQA